MRPRPRSETRIQTILCAVGNDGVRNCCPTVVVAFGRFAGWQLHRVQRLRAMWNALAYVTTGISLAGFLAALAVYLSKAALSRTEQLIRTAPERDRGRLVEASLESFHIDTTGLTRDQKFQLALQQISARERRFKEVAKVILFLAIVIAALAAYAIKEAARSRPALDGPVAPDSHPDSGGPKPVPEVDAANVANEAFTKWPLVRRDDFSADSDWWTGQSNGELSNLNVTVEDGQYRFEFALAPAAIAERFLDAPYTSTLQFYFAFDFRIVQPGKAARVSAYFGKGGDREYEIRALNNYLWLTRREGSSVNTLVWASLASTPGHWQRVGIAVDDQIIRAFVDSKLILEYRDAAVNGGAMGFLVGSDQAGDSVVVEFDNIELRRP